ncbi:MAG: hypothetical protein WBV82_23565 [Myxococcaceae bacterium]
MTLRRLAVVLLALALPAGAGAEEPKRSKTTVSAKGDFSVRLVELGPKKCRLEVLKESIPWWHLERCVGTVDDLYFVSSDGARVWVVKTIPQKASVRRATRMKYPAWTYVEVAALYGRDGSKLKSKQLNDFVKSRGGLDDVRQLERHFKWLEGVTGVPGKAPRLNDAGQVQLETVEPKSFKLEF